MSRMDDDALLAQIEHLERQAVGYYGGEVAKEQATAMDYYLGKPFGTEEEGRSQVVSSDVWDVVEGLTPLVLAPFVASDDVVRFNPLGPDDVEAAQQESDYINFVVTQKNDVFNELVSWVKTGLLQKNGIVKFWWEKSRKASIERYAGLSDDVYTAIIAEEGVEVVEHTETQTETRDEATGQPAVETMHDVTLRFVETVGEPKFRVLPPEEFLISRDATSTNPQLARFAEHRTRMTLSQLREMGYEVKDDLADGFAEDQQFSEQYQARRSSEENQHLTDDYLDPASREVILREVYLDIDRDGDGFAELRKVCIVGRTILSDEETEEKPFCAWTPYTQPFKFYGRCPADETVEIQLIKSTLWRQSLDNIYTVNNNRVFVSDKVNLDDLLDNQIAGVVRVTGDQVGNHVMPAQVTPIGAIVQPMIEYLDSAKENRTGFTRYNQGSDSESLNKTATGIRLIQQSANSRIEIISRAFAEQGMAPLMRGIHGLCRRHATKAETLRLRGKWVEIDPRQWRTRSDMTVSVGLGNADRQMQMQGVQMLLQQQQVLAPVGIVTPENVYNAASKLAEIVGHKDPEKFFTSPQNMPPKAPPDPSQNPEFVLKARELELRSRELDIKEQTANANAANQEGTLALAAEAQGHDMALQVMQSIAALQRQIHDMQQGQAQFMMQAQGQAHDQQMAQQGVAHERQLAAQEAAEPEEPTSGPA